MKITELLFVGACAALVGCATSNLPSGARLVGGGLEIKYDAPSDGTAILLERTSGRIVATESLARGSRFSFGPNYVGCNEVINSMFGATNVQGDEKLGFLGTNTYFQLYFVEAKANQQ